MATKLKIKRFRTHHHFWIEDNILYESYTTIRGLRYAAIMKLKDGACADTDNVDAELEHQIANEYFNK